MRFFVGMHMVSKAHYFNGTFISVNVLRNRKSDFVVGDWIMDSGAFTAIFKHGGFPRPVSDYAKQIRRWKVCGNMLAAVSEDYMCEDAMLKRTGLTIPDHQRLTIERYDALVAENTGVYILPVLQGYASSDYVSHLRQYGERLAHGAWVGVGSVCKRNGSPLLIWKVLEAIKAERPDLQLHGFGVKKTSLAMKEIRDMLYTSDSMAWSFNARWEGRGPDANKWEEAQLYVDEINRIIGA